MHAIAKKLGADWQWIAQTIQKIDIQGELRQIPPFGKLAMHFPPMTFDLLSALHTQHSPANGWLTANTLVTATGKSHNWVSRRLHGFYSEVRKDEHGVSRKHYPPEVLQELKSRIGEDNRGKRPQTK